MDSRRIDLALAAALDAWAVLMPVDCAGCGAPDRGLCADCRSRLAPDVGWHSLADGTPVASALEYEGVPRRVILAFKDHGRTDAARPLAAALGAAITAALSTSDGAAPGLAPVPTSRSSFRRRGYDPVRLLVRRTGHRTSDVLVHTRGTEQQKTLDLAARSRNLAGSLRARHPLDGRSFILIDDVMTTGATLAEAARAIRHGGGIVVSAATVAHTPRLFGSRGSSS